MFYISTLLLLLFAFVLTFIILPLVFLWFLSIVGSKAPFVPVPWAAVPGIVQALAISSGGVVYDIGCGDGRILFAIIKKYPKIKAIGIEKALLPYLIARARGRVELRHADLFSQNLGEATHVVMYLFPWLMDRVEAKLERELKPGTCIVAIDFPLPRRTPTKIVDQNISGLKRGTKLYIYD